MAEVKFFGIGADGFPDPDVQLYQDIRSRAEVINEGPVINVGQDLNDNIEIFSPTLTAGEDIEVDFFPNQIPPLPVSENPNENELVFYVVTGFGGSALPVKSVTVPLGLPAPPDLLLYRGPLGPSGLSGKTLVFISPTGGTPEAPAFTPGIGFKAKIVNHTNDTFNLDTALPAGVTLTDRVVVIGADRALRRTPVIEIILE